MFLLLLSKLVTPNNISNPPPLQTDPNWSRRPNAPYLVGQRMCPNVGAADALKLQYIECTLTGQGNKIKALCEKIFALHLIICIRTIIILL